MSLDWQEELATGIDTIDVQHKGIFARFAAFKTACNAGCEKAELEKLVDFLENYTRDHFRDEEQVLLEVQYPDLSIQQLKHAYFLNEITELKRKVSENEAEMPEILEMKRLLIRWLILHIKHLDMAYVDYLKRAVPSM